MRTVGVGVICCMGLDAIQRACNSVAKKVREEIILGSTGLGLMENQLEIRLFAQPSYCRVPQQDN